MGAIARRGRVGASAECAGRRGRRRLLVPRAIIAMTAGVAVIAASRRG